MSRARARALFILVLTTTMLVAETGLTPDGASADTSLYWCQQFAEQSSPAYRGWLSSVNSVSYQSGPDMQGDGYTVNGLAINGCQAVSGWSAEVGALGFYFNGSGYVGCPGAYSLQLSTTGLAHVAVFCDGAQYYQLATSHRVWFGGAERGSGWRYLNANW
jgi:hypothetical protein